MPFSRSRLGREHHRGVGVRPPPRLRRRFHVHTHCSFMCYAASCRWAARSWRCLQQPRRLQTAPAACMATEQRSEFVARQVGPDVLDLSVGQPAPGLLPLDLVHTASQHRLGPDGNRADAALLLQYGPFRGYRSFRDSLASFLSERTGCAVPGDHLMVTAGVSHGLDLAVRHLSQPGDIILVESPTYPLAQRIFDQNRLQTLPIRTDEGGLDTEHLEQELLRLRAGSGAAATTSSNNSSSSSSQASGSRGRPRLVYTVPTHSNPRGVSLSEARRRHLVRLAHEHGLLVLADEVYQLLSFPGEAPQTPLRQVEKDMGLVGPGQPSQVVSLNSMSKVVAPGLRLGWVEAGPETLAVLQRDGAIGSGGCIASLSAGLAHSALELGLIQEHIDGLVRPQLARNAQALCDALRKHLPGCTFQQPSGGYFVWLQLPAHVDATQLLEPAIAHHKVRFTPGPLCGGPPGPGAEQQHTHCMRLCFAFYTPVELEEAVQRLARAVNAYQEEHEQKQQATGPGALM